MKGVGESKESIRIAAMASHGHRAFSDISRERRVILRDCRAYVTVSTSGHIAWFCQKWANTMSIFLARGPYGEKEPKVAGEQLAGLVHRPAAGFAGHGVSCSYGRKC